MYIALGYVDTGKKQYMPGEVIEEDYESSKWHLKIGAIREVITVNTPVIMPVETPEPEAEAIPAEAADPGDEREIDVMAGVVKKPARKRTKKGGQET